LIGFTAGGWRAAAPLPAFGVIAADALVSRAASVEALRTATRAVYRGRCVSPQP
jgi:hypothetical protein